MELNMENGIEFD